MAWDPHQHQHNRSRPIRVRSRGSALIKRHRAPQHRAVVEAILLAKGAIRLDDRQCIEVAIEPVAHRHFEIMCEPIRNPSLRIEIEDTNRAGSGEGRQGSQNDGCGSGRIKRLGCIQASVAKQNRDTAEIFEGPMPTQGLAAINT